MPSVRASPSVICLLRFPHSHSPLSRASLSLHQQLHCSAPDIRLGPWQRGRPQEDTLRQRGRLPVGGCHTSGGCLPTIKQPRHKGTISCRMQWTAQAQPPNIRTPCRDRQHETELPAVRPSNASLFPDPHDTFKMTLSSSVSRAWRFVSAAPRGAPVRCSCAWCMQQSPFDRNSGRGRASGRRNPAAAPPVAAGFAARSGGRWREQQRAALPQAY